MNFFGDTESINSSLDNGQLGPESGSRKSIPKREKMQRILFLSEIFHAILQYELGRDIKVVKGFRALEPSESYLSNRLKCMYIASLNKVFHSWRPDGISKVKVL